MKGANDTKAKKSNSSQLDKKTAATSAAKPGVVVDKNNNTSDDINNNNSKLKSKMPSKLKDNELPANEKVDIEVVKSNESLEGQEVNVSSNADEKDSPVGEKSAAQDGGDEAQAAANAADVGTGAEEGAKNDEGEQANGGVGDDEQATQAKNDKKSATMTTDRGLNKFGQPRRGKYFSKYGNSFGTNPQFGSSVPPYYAPFNQYTPYGPAASHEFPPLSYDNKHKQPYFNQYNQPAYYFQGAQYGSYYPGSTYHGQFGGVPGGRFYGAGNAPFNGSRRPYNGQQPFKSKYNKAHHGGQPLDGQKTANGEAGATAPANVDQVNGLNTETNGTSENSAKAINNSNGGMNVGNGAVGHVNNAHSTGGAYPGSGNYYYKKDRMASVQLMTSKTNIYIKGLDENTTDKDLYEMCQKFGEIKSTKAIIEKQNGKCKGYGFVDYKNPEDARKALEEMKKEHKDVQLAKQREQDPTNLYFANLPAEIDEKCLTEMLQNKFNASVSSTRIMRERSGASKGVGFARIDDNSICDTIIKELNNRPFPDHSNKTKLLLVKLADSGSSLKTRTTPLMRMPLNGAPLYIPAQTSTLDNHSTTTNPLSSNTTLKGTQGAMPTYPYIDPAVNTYNGFSLQMLDGQHGATSLVAQQPHHYQSQQQSLPHGQISHNGANTGYYNHHQMQQPMTYGNRQSGSHQYSSGMTPVGTQVQGQTGQIGLGQQQPANQYHYQSYQQSYYSAGHMQQPHHQSPSASAGSYMVYTPANGFQQGSAPSQLNGISQNPSENGTGLESSSTAGPQAGTSPNGTSMSTSSTLNNSSNPMTASLSSQFVSSAQFSTV